MNNTTSKSNAKPMDSKEILELVRNLPQPPGPFTIIEMTEGKWAVIPPLPFAIRHPIHNPMRHTIICSKDTKDNIFNVFSEIGNTDWEVERLLSEVEVRVSQFCPVPCAKPPENTVDG